MTTTRNAAEHLLLAAESLCLRTGDIAFTSDEIAVEVWRLFPDRFSLRCDPRHCDSHRVSTWMHGINGPAARGWMRRIKRGDGFMRWAINESGAEHLKTMRLEEATC